MRSPWTTLASGLIGALRRAGVCVAANAAADIDALVKHAGDDKQAVGALLLGDGRAVDAAVCTTDPAAARPAWRWELRLGLAVCWASSGAFVNERLATADFDHAAAEVLHAMVAAARDPATDDVEVEERGRQGRAGAGAPRSRRRR